MEVQLLSVDLGNHAKPTKECAVRGSVIQRRRWRATVWDKVKYRSASCRRVAVATARTAGEVNAEGRAYRACASLLPIQEDRGTVSLDGRA